MFPCSFCSFEERVEVTSLFSGKSLNVSLPATGPLATISSTLSKLGVQNCPLHLNGFLRYTSVHRFTILVSLIAFHRHISSPADPRCDSEGVHNGDPAGKADLLGTLVLFASLL